MKEPEYKAPALPIEVLTLHTRVNAISSKGGRGQRRKSVAEEEPGAARILVQDLQRARSFYAEKLGLEPSEERPGGLLYRCGEGELVRFESAGAASGHHTQMAGEVEDIEATVEWLRVRGVVFEEYDFPGLRTVNGIAEVRDSEGNLFGINRPPMS